MNIIQIVAASICICVIALAVKDIKRDMGQLISIGATLMVMTALIPYITKIVATMYEFSSLCNGGQRFLMPILKITGISYISQIGAELCRDSGEASLAARVESAGKIAVTVIVLPVAKEAFMKIMEILS